MIATERKRFYLGGKIQGLEIPKRVFPCKTPEQVREIRKATDTTTANIYELAFEYSVWPSTIQNVIKFKTWKHIK